MKSSLRMELAKTYGAAGDLAALERLNEAAIAAHAKLDKALRSMSKPIDVYFWAAQGAVEAEDLESAQRMAARVTDPSYRDFTASMVLGLQAKQDPRGALGAARAIPDATSRISAMATIAAAIARSAPPASPGPR